MSSTQPASTVSVVPCTRIVSADAATGSAAIAATASAAGNAILVLANKLLGRVSRAT